MKQRKNLLVVGFFLLFSVVFLFGSEDVKKPAKASTPEVVVKATPELLKKYPMKPHHANLSFACTDCHEGQGDDPTKFKAIGDKGCLSCHKSKQYLAKRLKFMDDLHVNPHNSIHDGPNLYCDECHFEHKKSINMCAECHEHDVKIWMKATP